MNISRKTAIKRIAATGAGIMSFPFIKSENLKATNLKDTNDSLYPSDCDFAPPGQYIKDHTFVFHDGWWHLYSISGTQGYYWGYTGNEETISWSISKNLVDWEFRGHVIHPSLRKGTFDQHGIWAPFCVKANDKFYMFYTGIIQPHRPMEYRKLGQGHPANFSGHRETQGVAVSEDLTEWVKIADTEKGLGVRGRDSHVIWDDMNNRWLLYSTGKGNSADGKHYGNALVSQSTDLLNWEYIGSCALFQKLDTNRNYGYTIESWNGFKYGVETAESMFVMRHPKTGKWILMGNWQYCISDDPTDFWKSEVRYFDNTFNGKIIDLGFACEIIKYGDKWYRSGTFGTRDYWRLGLTEIEWEENGAFKVVRPSITTNK